MIPLLRIIQLRLTPGSWFNLVRKSYKECIAGNYFESINLAEKALKINPRASEAYRLIGNSYEFLGDEKQEEGDLEKAREFHRMATEAWDKARKINPLIIIPGYHGYR